jgi:hypothetical protein
LKTTGTRHAPKARAQQAPPKGERARKGVRFARQQASVRTQKVTEAAVACPFLRTRGGKPRTCERVTRFHSASLFTPLSLSLLLMPAKGCQRRV